MDDRSGLSWSGPAKWNRMKYIEEISRCAHGKERNGVLL